VAEGEEALDRRQLSVTTNGFEPPRLKVIREPLKLGESNRVQRLVDQSAE
jgi:hypothetical protein